MQKNIVIPCTMDTKGNECLFLKEQIIKRGHNPTIVDISCKEFLKDFNPDFTCLDVAEAAKVNFEVVSRLDRRQAINLMIPGALIILKKLQKEGRLDGLIGLGGGNGTLMICEIMKAFPLGLPKLMVSTVASRNVRPYVGAKDIVMMHSVGDICLNSFMKGVIARAVGAIVGMVETEYGHMEQLSTIGATMFGVTQPCVLRVKSLLEKEGFDILVFHSVGTGGMAMEELIREGSIKGVVDITTHELADELFGGLFSAGPSRLSAGCEMKIPQVIVPGGLDIINFTSDNIPQMFKKRTFYRYTSGTTLMRTNKTENYKLGKLIAERLNRASKPVSVVIPLRGFSSLDIENGVSTVNFNGEPYGQWCDLDANQSFCRAIEKFIDPSIVQVIKLDMHINDPAFADQITLIFNEKWKKK